MPSYLGQFLKQFFSVLIVLMGFSPARGAWPEPNKNAPQGGTFTLNLGAEPANIHPIMSTDVSAQTVMAYTTDTLLGRDPNTYQWGPRIAEKYEISKDKKVFTFFLRKNVVFHDGKPLTAEDVKFSFDAIFEPKYQAAHLRPYYEGIEKVEVVDPHTVKFYTKDTYFNNFNVAAGLEIIPKHVYSDVEKSKKMTRTFVGAGPYTIDKYERGQRIILKKFDKWYGNGVEDFKGENNFERVVLRFVRDGQVALEMLKKGDLDYIEPLMPEEFVKKMEGPPFGTTVLKFKAENLKPRNSGFIGFNLRKPLFKDKNVRLALAHLMNREMINEKFRFGMSLLATGPWYQQSDYASKSVKPILFDPKKAGELLKKAGWTDSDKNGILDKVVDGKKQEFRFEVMNSNKDTEKYWTLWKEDLKKAGIELEVKYVEWQSFVKLIDEYNFDTVAMAWGAGSVDLDPKQIWHSSSAVTGGSNFIGYSNAEVDKLIDAARFENDKAKRIKMLQKVYEKIASDVPYVFLFNEKYILYAVRNRIGRPGETFQYDTGRGSWWVAQP